MFLSPSNSARSNQLLDITPVCREAGRGSHVWRNAGPGRACTTAGVARRR